MKKWIILPGTDPEIIEKYEHLAQRAEVREFGLMEEDIVVVDTETTGLDVSVCELTEIAAARMSGHKVIDRFQTFVNPGMPIPDEIVELTSITDEMVAGAPSPVEAVKMLAEFVAGTPIVAHNVGFDRKFLEHAGKGTFITDTWYDSLFMSRVALPRLKSHKLAEMADAFEVAAVSHRATDDVDALCAMWRIMLVSLSEMPEGMLGRLAAMHEDVEWVYRPLFSFLAAETPQASFSLKDARFRRVNKLPQSSKVDADELESVEAPLGNWVSDAFSADGTIGHMYEGYEPRGEQIEMANEIAAAFETDTYRAIEAGTGVGKSIAYLLPAAILAKKNNITMGVATKTNALTDQLIRRELPLLSEALGEPLTYFALKGYDHYPCMRKLDRLLVGEGVDKGRVDGKFLDAVALMTGYSVESPYGDLDFLNIPWRRVSKESFTTTSDECLHRLCPYYADRCFVHGARKRAANADIVVTNHSLLFRNIAADGAILPPIRHWVVDEAHSVEAEARRQWALSVSVGELRNLVDYMGGTRTGVLGRLIKVGHEQNGGSLLVNTLNKVANEVSRVNILGTNFFEAVKEIISLAENDRRYDNVTLWLSDEVRNSRQWSNVQAAGAPFVEHLDHITHLAQDSLNIAQEDVPASATELAEVVRRLGTMLATLETILSGADKNYVYSAKLNRKSTVDAEELIAERLDIGAQLASDWYPEMKSVIYASATISIADKFDHFNNAVGFDRLSPARSRGVQLESSYNFDKNMQVIVAKDMPEPNSSDYLDGLEKLLMDVHVAMKGATLTLFTNRREMTNMFERLEEPLRAIGIKLICQQKGVSTGQLRGEFLRNEKVCLFALKTFWEGFDASGDTLRCVVIPKLPFSSPSDPMSKERKLREPNSWSKYVLPEAVLTMKQAAGRLIRSSTDTGCLVLADKRLVSKGYGKIFLRSLPKKEYEVLSNMELSDFLSNWRM